MDNQPIVPIVCRGDPLDVIETIAIDLFRFGQSNEDRRAGRRLMGALIKLKEQNDE